MTTPPKAPSRFSKSKATGATPTPAAQTNTAPASTGGSWFYQGNAAMKEDERYSAEQKAKAAQRNGPMRFFMKKGEEPRRIVVLDSGENMFGLYEWDIYTAATKEMETFVASPYGFDPIEKWANTAKPQNTTASKTMKFFLSIIDLNEWTDKEGNLRTHSKRLLALKGDAKDAMLRILDQAGTLRGLVLDMTRNGDKSPGTGVPNLVLENGAVLRLTEEEIVAEFGHEEKKTQKGDVYAKANADCYPYEYTSIFQEPDIKAQCARFNVAYTPIPGSSEFAEKALGNIAGNTEATVTTDKPKSRLNLKSRTTEAAPATTVPETNAAAADLKAQAEQEITEGNDLPWNDGSDETAGE